jgi:hypothetical protein
VIGADVRHAVRAKGGDAPATNATTAKVTDVTSTKATYVSTAKAAHVASASATSAGLCTRCKKAAGKHCACQNHYNSSFHDILHWDGRSCSPQVLSDVGVSQDMRRPLDGAEIGMSSYCLY